MNDALLADVRAAIDEFGFKADKTGWLRGGKCPNCGKKELYTHGDHPWVLRCGRLNKCGYEGHVKDMYPELFSDWSKRAAQQPEAEANPNAAADLYMQAARGFDLQRVRGWYTQEHYTDHKADGGRGASTATVRFAFGPTWWQRLIDRPHRFAGKKATFKYGQAWAGHWWKPPTLDLASVKKLWLTEGIFNTIALDHAGIASASIMSSSNYPDIELAALRQLHAQAGTSCTLVWALDADPAGRRATAKHVERARAEGWECEAAQVPQRGKVKRDWNDLHQLDLLKPEHLAQYLYHGALLIAESASAKGLLMYRHSGGKRTAFAFDHGNRLYWFKLDLEAFNRAVQQLEKEGRHDSDDELREEALKAAHVIAPIANCLPRPLYYQANLLTDESWYYFRIDFPHDGAPIKNTFSASAIASASEFKKRLLSVAPGGMFTGNGTQLDRFVEDQLYQIQRVETIDFIGYCREHAAYLFNTLAVRQGEVVEINGDDFFDFGKLSLKSLNQSVHLAINADAADYSGQWLQLLWECFGAKGLAALAFWFGTLFAEQIRAKHKSWPFLEVVGEAGAGKSTLIEFLWKLLGRGDYEGFDPSKSSLAARARNFAQVANLPVVLIESDREKLGGEKGPHVKSFDWDELKTAFNGRSVRARGMATGGNETYEPPFRGAIVISQNNPVQASEPILQRICHLTFDRAGQTPRTRAAAIELEQMPLSSVSGWILRAVRAEQRVLELLERRLPELEAQLLALPGVKSTRIAKNHAQLAAAAEALALVTPLTQDMAQALQDQVFAMAAERQAAINMDHPIVSEFWETFDYLDGAGFPLNHARDPQNFIAVSLPHFLQGCRERGQSAPLMADLKKLLPTSKRHKFVEAKVVNSAIRDDMRHSDKSSSVFCWVFERKASRKG